MQYKPIRYEIKRDRLVGETISHPSAGLSALHLYPPTPFHFIFPAFSSITGIISLIANFASYFYKVNYLELYMKMVIPNEIIH